MRQGETVRIAEPFSNLCRYYGWDVRNLHGNQFQMGMPDAFLSHPKYSCRFVEFKIEGHPFTTAQRKIFPIFITNNVPLYVIEGVDFRGVEGKEALHRAYKKIFGTPNVGFYLCRATRRYKI